MFWSLRGKMAPLVIDVAGVEIKFWVLFVKSVLVGVPIFFVLAWRRYMARRDDIGGEFAAMSIASDGRRPDLANRRQLHLTVYVEVELH